MRTLTALMLSFALASGVSGAANAAMSKSDMKTMKKCQSMSESAMMKNKKCMAMMKKHPDMNSGSMGSGSMGSGSMNSNMKK